MFDRCVYINLDSRPDRRKQIETQLANQNILAERFPAICPTDAQGHDTRGALGCKLSHLAILKAMIPLNAVNVYMVVEDDAWFYGDFRAIFPLVCAELEAQPDWELWFPYIGNALDPGVVGKYLRRISGTQCTHCYMVHRRGFERFHRAWSNLSDKRDIDEINRTAGFKTYGTVPKLVEQAHKVFKVYDSDVRPRQ